MKDFTFVKKCLFNVVNKAGGTSYRNRIISSQNKMSGKTSTIQVVAKSSSREDLNKAEYLRRNHALFLGYYPSHQPQYAITVLVEHGASGGKLATEIAKNTFLML